MLAGCTQAPDGPEPTSPEAEAFVLDLLIVDLGRSDEKTANPGAHCGTAQRQGSTLTIWLWPDEQAPDGPWLAVFPEMPDDWHATLGNSPYKARFPATPDPEVQGDDTTLGELVWEPQGQEGTMRLEGKAVALPHSWSVTGEDGSWRADATLEAWDGTVKIERYSGLCD